MDRGLARTHHRLFLQRPTHHMSSFIGEPLPSPVDNLGLGRESWGARDGQHVGPSGPFPVMTVRNANAAIMNDRGCLVVGEIPFALISSEQRWFPSAGHLGGAFPLGWEHLEGPEEGRDSRGACATYAIFPSPFLGTARATFTSCEGRGREEESVVGDNSRAAQLRIATHIMESQGS